MTNRLNRRSFFKACGKTALLAAAAGGAMRPGMAMAHLMDDAPSVLLVDRDGAPLRASALRVHQTLVFDYPYVATPAMLIALDGATAPDITTQDTEGNTYAWTGGVGPGRNIVAYVAVCPHALSYVGRDISFLHYTESENQFGLSNVITCCAHGSTYDPAEGAKVLKGPSEYPLATVILHHDETDDTLMATGVIGTEMFKKFYDAYRKELRETYGRKRYRKTVAERAVALPMNEYAEDTLEC